MTVEVKVKRKGSLVHHGKGYHPKNWRQRLGAMTLASALFEVAVGMRDHFARTDATVNLNVMVGEGTSRT